MRICAVDFKSNEANICLLESNQGLFEVPECRARKFTITDVASAEQIRNFQKQFAKLMEDYKVDKIVIRERPTKGKFAGSAAGFKMEAALQLIDGIEAEVFPSSEMKQSLKRNPIAVSLKEVGLKQFQEHAFMTACAYLSK
ncbi:DUF3010 domain-containing protein [Grimontia hollisae]|uniref:DUF3010 domain-containing protein n=2 Tax=Grimontia hollisae TaxID=673 RepID=D0I5M8_GRIHO|nr:DUF3010 family protein [Grimontia hollisae]AMG29199.1 DUF3010 domain-containing protein [Grimontia hollisae]EEY73192.1 hypothetical protein VHA_001045 [Grimontia hollisae CIP 101886]MDF2184934.1 DUF3010 family protein [Grimontia hollisae]STO76695.1 Protein of uncharacterised function (DUF3010) [Grimontia hollisae]STO98082.1 Protein of uncharacterised function (DUF3010) [Grimontia hollisae]